MLKAILPFLISILITTNLVAERITVVEYVDHYKDIAISEMYRSGIPASIKLGQGILESDCGNSVLSKNSNNHFGIKCKKEWTGKTYQHKDDDYKNGKLIKSCFRAYYSSYESYIDHSEFLSNRDRYKMLFNLHHTDYKQWAFGLKSAGYATAKGYAEKLISIIERYELHQYDFAPNTAEEYAVEVEHSFQEGEELTVLGEVLPAIDIELEKIDSVKIDAQILAEMPKIKPAKPILFPVQTKEYFEINGRVAVTYKSNLETIINKTEIKKSKILKYNEVKTEAELINNQYLFISKKAKIFDGDFKNHFVKEGETMYIIAQLYGIRIKDLYKMNRMKAGEEPAPNTIVSLNGKISKKPKLASK